MLYLALCADKEYYTNCWQKKRYLLSMHANFLKNYMEELLKKTLFKIITSIFILNVILSENNLKILFQHFYCIDDNELIYSKL